jgi:hypothetical protein
VAHAKTILAALDPSRLDVHGGAGAPRTTDQLAAAAD